MVPGRSLLLEVLHRLPDFQESVTSEITWDYLIGTGRTFNINLFNKGCTDSITGMSITFSTTQTIEVTATHDELKTMLDLDKSAITSSSMLGFSFCSLNLSSVTKEETSSVPF